MGKSVTSDTITLGTKDHPVRVAFLRAYTPKPFQNGGDPRFECSFLLDPSDPVHAENIKELKAKGLEVATAVYGDDLEGLATCLTKGDRKNYDGYAGMMVLASHNKQRPVIVNRARTPVVEGDKEAPYSGCYCIGKVSLWAIKNQYPNRVSCNFKALQYVKDGPAFGGAAPIDADEEFEALEPTKGGTGSSGGVTKVSGKNPFEDD